MHAQIYTMGGSSGPSIFTDDNNATFFLPLPCKHNAKSGEVDPMLYDFTQQWNVVEVVEA